VLEEDDPLDEFEEEDPLDELEDDDPLVELELLPLLPPEQD